MWFKKDKFYNKNYLQFNRDNPTVNFVSFQVYDPKESQVYIAFDADNSDLFKYVSTIFMQSLGSFWNPNFWTLGIHSKIQNELREL